MIVWQHVLLAPVELVVVFQKLWISWDLPSQRAREFTRNCVTDKK